MIIHRINPASTRIETTEQPEEALAEVTIGQDGQTLLAFLLAGEAVFIDGFWLFASEVVILGGERLPIEQLSIQAGLTPRSGEPGSCDVQWIEFKRIVKRAACVALSGIEINMACEAGSIQ